MLTFPLMPAKTRMSSEERRETILGAARKIFSERGFHGATTRELAREASVSEALLFKHFPTKEAVYVAMLSACEKGETAGEVRRLLGLEPSTSTLAAMLHFIATKMLLGEHENSILRLLLRSLSEDGEFTRMTFKHFGSSWVKKVHECLGVAHKSGDLGAGRKLKCSGWLAHHLVMMLAFMHTPNKEGIVEYKLSKEQLAEEYVVFCMRGLGVTEEAIKKYYNPQAFALLSSSSRD